MGRERTCINGKTDTCRDDITKARANQNASKRICHSQGNIPAQDLESDWVGENFFEKMRQNLF